MQIDADELMSQEPIAKRLKLSQKTLEAMRVRGNGPPFIRVGRLVRYSWRDVQAWLDSRRVHSTSEAR